MKITVDTHPTIYNKTIGVITLNNPKALNAQDLEMVRTMHDTLKSWEKDGRVVMVLLCGAGDKALCAGGDIKSLAQGDDTHAKDFFEHEYALMAYMHRYPKPILAWGNGIVMGGGLGLLAASSHKVATQHTLMAMPEVSIGLFPDAGASWFLNTMMGKIGLFLGLTGARFDGADARFLGLADFLISHEDFLQIQQGLTQLDFGHNAHLALTAYLNGFINQTLYTPSKIIEAFDDINQLMNAGSLLAVNQALLGYQGHQFIEDAICLYKEGSAITKALTWQIYHKLKRRDLLIDEIFEMEGKVAVNCVTKGDFKEGVRALLIDKDKNPKFSYELADIPNGFIEQFFD